MSTVSSGVPDKWKKAREPRNLLFLLAVAAGFVYLSAPEFFAPWAHFTGGSFHAGDSWSGSGSFWAPDGQYQIYLYLKPIEEGSHPTRETGLVGEGDLCTPKGEKLPIHVSAGMEKPLPWNTVGRRIEISTFVRSRFGIGGMTPPGSPYVKLTGTWGMGKIEAAGVLDHQPVEHEKSPAPAPIAVTLRRASDWSSPPCRGR